MSVPRSLIELALNELASDEGGMRFQGLAVVLAKLRWPELLACERKKDLGLDAYAPSTLSQLGLGMGLSSSITNEFSKIKEDAERAKHHFPDLQILVFATSGKVTNETAQEWKKKIKEAYGWDLLVMSREDIITTLQIPQNASLCSTHLGIALSKPEPTIDALLEQTLAATDEVIAAWSRRTAGKPIIDLRLVRLDEKGAETQEMQQSANLNELLLTSHRIVIEGPAGRGKTTTLIQSARGNRGTGHPTCLVDIPAWVRRNFGIFDFLAGMPEFQSRGLSAIALARVNAARHFTFLLNGWNELAPSESTGAAGLIRDLERSFPATGIAITTRAHPVSPPLPGSSRFRIQKLTSGERAAYLRERLGGRANELLKLLNASRVLSDLTATPMILAEVTSLFEAGKPIPASKLGILNAVIRLMESSEEHEAPLNDDPLLGMARQYLEEVGMWLVRNGGVQIPESQARSVVNAVGHRLRESGQIGTAPDPGRVLTALYSHHVLERSTYPDVSYTFFHQQFQELFAALRLIGELTVVVTRGTGHAEFASKYINEPAWSEPLYMVAEFIGRHTDDEPLPQATAIGTELIRMALSIDPLFAAELARLCGADVWATTREPVASRLRQLYRSQSSVNRAIGLAGMIATGSSDFKDVIVPLLSSEDRNQHWETYRTWQSFQVSSLGSDWKQVVQQWNEGARADFVSEMIQHTFRKDDLISFALADPSSTVRKSLLSHIWWVMSPEELVQFSQTIDDDLFENLIGGFSARYIPTALRPRAASVYERIGTKSTDLVHRLSAWTEAARLGNSAAFDLLKVEISGMDTATTASASPWLQPIIEFIETTESEWVTDWARRGLLSGALREDVWIQMVRNIPIQLRDELLDQFTTEIGDTKPMPGAFVLLRSFADEVIVRRLFHRLCELRPIVTSMTPGNDRQSQADQFRRIEELIRQMPLDLVVRTILLELAAHTGPTEIEVTSEIFHMAGREAMPLREVLSVRARNDFRNWIRASIPVTLTQHDRNGQTQAYLATVLAQIGDASDIPDLETLLRTDLERMRAERSARAAAATRGKRGTGS